ncbi:hypothetical protein [Streptomyces sp. NPDC094149]|uniref:hypothetical protein n=1 Tax=Streptomyces sp. NPDC094149 TaxID=3155079 RepID=UPI003316B844
MAVLNDEDRAEIARWAELMTAARRKYREREAIENRRRVTRMEAFGNMRFAGMPAHLVREYQQARRKREERDV